MAALDDLAQAGERPQDGDDAAEGTAETEPARQDDAEQPDFEHHAQLFRWIKAVNIADDLDEQLLGEIGSRVEREYKIDVNSRSDWKTKTDKAVELAMQMTQEKQYPWPKAANVIFPLLTTAATQFAARAYPAIINGRNVAKGVVVGEDKGTPAMINGQPVMGPNQQPQWVVPPGMKRARAEKIGEHMSWQLLDEQPEWEPDTDRMLNTLPIIGCLYRKSYFDPSLGRNASQTVSSLHVVINYKAKSLETAPRVTEEIELYPHEIEEKVRAGMFLEHEYGLAPNGDGDEDAPHEFLEQHRYLDLDEDGYKEPYIVTVHKQTCKVARIVARYEADGIKVKASPPHKIVRIEPVHYYTQYDFLPNPDGGIYGVGFGQLLRPINEAVNTTLNMMLDAGHLQVVGGGFIGKGLSMRAGAIRFAPGEFKPVNVTGQAVRDSIVPLETPGPSPVLFQLLGLLIEAGKDVASIKDVLAGDVSAANIAPTTMMALVEQGLKVFTSIYKRVNRSLKAELAKLYRLNRIYLPQETSYRIGSDWKFITRDDYAKGAGVEPIADPNMVSDMQRLARAQFLLGFKDDPRCNGQEIIRRAFDAANIDKPEACLLPIPPPNPAVLAKMAELNAKAMELKTDASRQNAAAVKDYSMAVYYLAAADKAVGDQKLAALEHNLNVLTQLLETAANAQPGGPGSAPLNPGGNGTGLPGLAPPPGQ